MLLVVSSCLKAFSIGVFLESIVEIDISNVYFWIYSIILNKYAVHKCQEIVLTNHFAETNGLAFTQKIKMTI